MSFHKCLILRRSDSYNSLWRENAVSAIPVTQIVGSCKDEAYLQFLSISKYNIK